MRMNLVLEAGMSPAQTWKMDESGTQAATDAPQRPGFQSRNLFKGSRLAAASCHV